MSPSAFLNRRANARYKTTLSALARIGQHEFTCRLIDISAGGAGLAVPTTLGALVRDKHWHIEVTGIVSAPAIRMWQSGSNIGLRFDIKPARRKAIDDRIIALAQTSNVLWLSSD